ncbi:ER membrane protein Wsc4 [Aspergillus sclerotialis]|uniref:ER membrane protein Wsc4 n=1 Tax=Aspergillus sclerotialis TaxID=2070753 RepID=A0A3A3A1N4_9EURO|nr:ER membrane protein Wsc4 [Aspergillus sclerotialis]
MYLFVCLLILALASWPISGANTGGLTYCSSQNTGTFLANTSIYQSNGNCQKYCTDDYAFGILQGKNCWCSNLAPASEANTDSSKCGDGCPGYPDDPCGNAGDGLYAYLEMDLKMPSGTASLSTTGSATSTSASTESAESITETVTVTASGSSRSTLVTESTPSTTSATSATTTTGTASTTQSDTVSVHTLGGGEVKTVTVSMPSSTSDADAAVSTTSSGSHMKGGTIAGIVVGTVGGCAAILALIFVLFIMRRRKRASSPDPSVQNGLIDGGRSPQMGIMGGTFSDSHSHTLSAGSSNANRLQTTFTDDRMKPNPLYPNGERGSSVSLQDHEDYSRPVLRLTNPD